MQRGVMKIASWRYPEAWDMLMFGLRLGPDPRVVVTTTPKPIKIIRELIADPTTAITRDSTYDNRANLELRDSASRGDVSDREPLIRVPLNLSHLQSVVRTWGMYPPSESFRQAKLPVFHESGLCGGIKYEITGPLLRPLNCHCSRCRKAQGVAFRSLARVRIDDFRWLQGDELVKAGRGAGGYGASRNSEHARR